MSENDVPSVSQTEHEASKLSEPNLPPEEINPWRAMWFHPRRAIHSILNHDAGYCVKSLAILNGMLQMVPAMVQKTGLTALAILLPVLIGGVLGGLIALYLFGALYRWTGSWFGGEADSTATRAAIAWSNLPNMAGVTAWLIIFFLLKILSAPSGILHLVQVAQFVLLILCSVWSFLLACRAMGAAHGFSSWKGFFTILIGNFMILIPIILLLLVLGVSIAGLIGMLKGGQTAIPKQVIMAQRPSISIPLPQKPAPAAAQTVPAALPSLPAIQNVEIPGASDTDLDALRLAQAKVRTTLKDGTVIDAVLLDYDRTFLFLESSGRVTNVAKSSVAALSSAMMKEKAISPSRPNEEVETNTAFNVARSPINPPQTPPAASETEIPMLNPVKYINMAKQTAMLAELKKLHAAANIYYAENGSAHFALDELVNADLISSSYRQPNHGYRFTLKVSNEGPEVYADPVQSTPDAEHFMYDSNGALRMEKGKSAAPSSPFYRNRLTGESEF